jgi:hypothetical protein
VRIEPETQTISQGAIGELRCTATGDPAPIIRWSKLNEELGSNIQASHNGVSSFYFIIIIIIIMQLSFHSWNSITNQDTL